MLGNFQNEFWTSAFNFQGIQNRWQTLLELYVDYGTNNGHNATFVDSGLFSLCGSKTTFVWFEIIYSGYFKLITNVNKIGDMNLRSFKMYDAAAAFLLIEVLSAWDVLAKRAAPSAQRFNASIIYARVIWLLFQLSQFINKKKIKKII